VRKAKIEPSLCGKKAADVFQNISRRAVENKIIFGSINASAVTRHVRRNTYNNCACSLPCDTQAAAAGNDSLSFFSRQFIFIFLINLMHGIDWNPNMQAINYLRGQNKVCLTEMN
jgi:hypothetical protein